jgi:peroxiredoxin
MVQPAFATVEEAFVYCRDMDASLSERLDTFAAAARTLRPTMQEAVDRMVERLKAHEAGAVAPRPGEPMPNFALPDETGRIVTLDALLAAGPVAITFHRGHWCPYCRINTRALSQVQDAIASEGASIVAILPERQQFAARFKAEAALRYPVLSDMDNGYALSIGLAIWVGAEVQELMAKSGRDLPAYQGNAAWILPIPATFVVGQDGRVVARFIDPDYRKRMAVEDLLAALRKARGGGGVPAL